MGTLQPTEVDNAVSVLERFGLMDRLVGGIQIDINAAPKKLPGAQGRTETSICNHDCVEKYVCQSAISLNKGASAHEYASWPSLLFRIDAAVEGLHRLRTNGYLERILDRLRDVFPSPYREAILTMYHDRHAKVEVNVFGGNPEMHPHVLELLDALRKRDARINLTTTGQRGMTEPEFQNALFECQPHLIAVSLDDVTAQDLERFTTCSLKGLLTYWRAITPMGHGQARKAIEAIYTARESQDRGGPKILFNTVIHPGNISEFFAIADFVGNAFPNSIINPFPAQESFNGSGGMSFADEHLEPMVAIIDFMIDRTHAGDIRFSRRLHYWIFLRSLFDRFSLSVPTDRATLLRYLSGYDGWKCYNPDSGRYVQIGKGPKGMIMDDSHEAGGKLGCYWNAETVTRTTEIESPCEVMEHLQGGMTALAATSENPCPGCIMPRLIYDIVNLVTGMEPALLPGFLSRRKQHIGF